MKGRPSANRSSGSDKGVPARSARADRKDGCMSILKEHLTTGLWDGGRCIIRSPRFTRLPEYRDGQVVLMVADLFLPEDDGQVLEGQRFSIGNGWVASDDETEIVGHEDGKKLKLNNNTALGHFVDSLAEVGGEELEKVLIERQKQGQPTTPFHVSLFDGLDVTLEQREKEFKTDSGEQATQRWYDVVEFHGYESTGAAKPAAKKAAKKVVKKAAAKVAADDPTSDGGGLDEAVLERIRQVAREANDYDEFLATCYSDIPEVAEDEAYQAIVDDATETGICAMTWDAMGEG